MTDKEWIAQIDEQVTAEHRKLFDANRKFSADQVRRQEGGDYMDRCFPDTTKQRFSDGLQAINEHRVTGGDPETEDELQFTGALMIPYAAYRKLQDDYEAVMREKRKLEIAFGLAVIGAISGWGTLIFVLAVMA